MVHFTRTGCAYIEPPATQIDRNYNCELSIGGTPVDSSAVYMFKSGTINSGYSNCRSQSGVDIFNGGTVSYNICNLAGTFDLTLNKKGGNTIVISEGKFEKNNIRR